MTIAAIDFGRLYRDHFAAASHAPKPASAWNARASGIGLKDLQSPYADAFIARMDLSGASTLLDVGCGAGTICLPLANRLQRVYALDYSDAMLGVLRDHAASLALGNVETLHKAWADDWDDVPPCDIVVASRSTVVEDMESALRKLNGKALRRVYLTNLVGGSFIDPAIPAMLGRKQPPLPDYIYIVNILYRMGVHPRLDYIESDKLPASAGDFASVARQVSWSLGELSADELDRLRDWHAGSASRVPPAPAMRWAFISWDTTPG